MCYSISLSASWLSHKYTLTCLQKNPSFHEIAGHRRFFATTGLNEVFAGDYSDYLLLFISD